MKRRGFLAALVGLLGALRMTPPPAVAPPPPVTPPPAVVLAGLSDQQVARLLVRMAKVDRDRDLRILG